MKKTFACAKESITINEYLPFQNGRQWNFFHYPTAVCHSLRLRPEQLGKNAYSVKIIIQYRAPEIKQYLLIFSDRKNSFHETGEDQCPVHVQ